MHTSARPRPTMRGITIHGNTAKISEVSLPIVKPTYLLAKVEAVALNPTDWKYIKFGLAVPGALSGCDFAGTVIEVATDVNKAVKPGDRIAGVVHGGNSPNACFAEYVIAKADLVIKLPDSIAFEKASTLPLGLATVGQGLYQQALQLQPPWQPLTSSAKQDVLIYGGSTATGTIAIQFATLSGYRVITTCSPKNFDLVRSLGADAVYDYSVPGVGRRINQDTNNGLKLVWDTLDLEESARICEDAISSDPAGARYGTIGPPEFEKEGVEPAFTMMYTIFNEPFVIKTREFAAKPEDFRFAVEFFSCAEKLLFENKLKPHPELVGQNGLEGVLQGLRDLRDEKVSGVKLVYCIADTPAGSQAEISL